MDVLRRGATKDGHHPRTSTRPRKAAILDGAGPALVGILPNTKAGPVTGTREEHRTLQTTPKVVRWRDRLKIKEEDVGTEEGGETVLDSKVNASEPVNATGLQWKRNCGNCSAC